jgi:proline iminopeptidase
MRASINGTEIYFDIVNSGSPVVERPAAKPTVFAIHGGLGFDHGYLRPGLNPLGDMARIVYVDLRGQGRSGRPPLETCSLDQMADDIIGLATMLGVRRPVILGHSAGGFVAMKAAARHPDTVGGLMLACTVPAIGQAGDKDGPPDPQLSDRAPADVLAMAKRYHEMPDEPQAVEDFLLHVRPYYAAPHYMDQVQGLLSLSEMAPEMFAHFRDHIVPTYDVREELAAITCPALVLCGAHDWVCPPSAGRDIARRIKGAELIEFANSGHFLFSEEPQTFQAAASKFLKGIAEGFEEEMR